MNSKRHYEQAVIDYRLRLAGRIRELRRAVTPGSRIAVPDSPLTQAAARHLGWDVRTGPTLISRPGGTPPYRSGSAWEQSGGLTFARA